MGARERLQRSGGEADGSETGGMAPDRFDLGAYPDLHTAPLPVPHSPCTARILAFGRIHGRIVWGGWVWSGAGTLEPHHLTP